MYARLTIVLAALLPAVSCPAIAKEPWADAMAAFERQDEQTHPPQGAIVFVGSSSIRLWNLKESFGDKPTINRGFGGSQAVDSAKYANLLVIKHRPSAVVIYAGDNDLAHGKSPQQVCDDVESLVQQVSAALPDAKLLYLTIKPSLARWKLIEQQRQANHLVEEMLARYPHAKLVDVATPLLGGDGLPRHDLFVADGLHLSKAGYQVWADVLRPLLP